MKKTYINPNMQIVQIATQQMLAGSLNPNSGSGSVNETSAPADVDGEGHFGDFDW